MKGNRALQAVIFDLDGVITDTAEYHYIAWKKLGESLDIPFDREFNEQLKGISREKSLARILRLGGKEHVYSAEEKEEFAHRKNEHYVSLLNSLTPEHTYPGIRELLLELQASGIPAVIASASKNAPQILRALELETMFSYVVHPDSVPRGKPAPDLFLRGAEEVGADIEACIGIEDAQAGIEAIKSAGMIAIGIGEEAGLKASGADVVLKDTKQLSLSFLERTLQEHSH
ncbi:beta-phosphoglucomutase [Paenibacillus silvae]|uniref:Beta-phosphoglucomutase n=1 Tax=Paenibacillus silvae TaxID=1325358 RepID=A0ABQ1ZL74_9BACL|nr:beta-phosphoglucomutase [Paenibacillus silvae]MCK6078609.1 beta-phosphoglucomutase [Paenibacillus silvae]MCK6152928.1 beta-phosphoglucomutase [Paenibacillus silvae]MCK6271438.1 beta-phosphoglucomutase [Paenibacillus silvae]GGH67430.1 beta-phosphoglucomutase [Paenibacillus silvae]